MPRVALWSSETSRHAHGAAPSVFGMQTRPQLCGVVDRIGMAMHDLPLGIDTALPSRDGTARAVPVLRVESLADTAQRVRTLGGTVVVEPFSIPGVGRGCYVVDPAGVLIGLHEYDPGA